MYDRRVWIAVLTIAMLMLEQVGAMPQRDSDADATNAHHQMHARENNELSSTHHAHKNQSLTNNNKSCHTPKNSEQCQNCDDCQCINGHCSSTLTGIITAYLPSNFRTTRTFAHYKAVLSFSSNSLLYRPPISV